MRDCSGHEFRMVGSGDKHYVIELRSEEAQDSEARANHADLAPVLHKLTTEYAATGRYHGAAWHEISASEAKNKIGKLCLDDLRRAPLVQYGTWMISDGRMYQPVDKLMHADINATWWHDGWIACGPGISRRTDTASTHDQIDALRRMQIQGVQVCPSSVEYAIGRVSMEQLRATSEEKFMSSPVLRYMKIILDVDEDEFMVGISSDLIAVDITCSYPLCAFIAIPNQLITTGEIETGPLLATLIPCEKDEITYKIHEDVFVWWKAEEKSFKGRISSHQIINGDDVYEIDYNDGDHGSAMKDTHGHLFDASHLDEPMDEEDTGNCAV